MPDNRFKIPAKLLAASLIILTALSACKQETEPVLEEKTELVIWYYWDLGKIRREFADLIDEFNRSQDRIVIRAQYVPDESFKKKMALAAADDELPDLALVDSSDFRYLHENHPFIDLTGEISELEEYFPKALEPCTIDGRQYGLPFGVNCLALFCNKESLNRAGRKPPETWSEFYDTAIALDGEGVDVFAISALQSEEAAYSFLPVLWSMGGSEDSLDSEESLAAFGLLGRLSEEGVLSKQCISMTLSDTMEQFAAGKIAMMFNTPMTVEAIRSKNPGLDFEVVPLPAGEEPVTIAGGEIFGVTCEEHRQEAVEFLRFVADKDRMEDYMDEFGFLAPRADVMKNQFKNDPDRRLFVTYYARARTRENMASWPKLSLVITDALSQVIIGESDEAEILKAAAGEISEIREEIR